MELFGARHTLVSFVRLPNSSTSYHRDRNWSQLRKILAANPFPFGMGCLIFGCACTRVASSSSTAYIRHALNGAFSSTLPGELHVTSLSLEGKAIGVETHSSTVSSCSTLNGEIHEASLLRGPRHSHVAAWCCLQTLNSFADSSWDDSTSGMRGHSGASTGSGSADESHVVLNPSRRAVCRQPSPGRPRHQRRDTSSVSPALPFAGSFIQPASLLEASINGYSAVGWRSRAYISVHRRDTLLRLREQFSVLLRTAVTTGLHSALNL